MGHWSVSCGISNIAITSGQSVVLLPLKKSIGGDTYTSYLPATLPIFGSYDDYGGIENIVKDANTQLIEEHFGVSIEDFCIFLVDGKFTYNREEAQEIAKRIKNLEECAEWRFMWIDLKVWNFMTTHVSQNEMGHLKFGNSKILELIGFQRDGDSLDKRFNQRWTFQSKSFVSDGTYLQTDNGQAIYNFSDGYGALSEFISTPEDKFWIGKKAMWQLWEYLDEDHAFQELSYIIGIKDPTYDINRPIWTDDFIESVIQAHKSAGKSEESLEQLRIRMNEIREIRRFENSINFLYLRDLKSFGSGLCDLITLRHNMHPMSGDFRPHQLYLTPQDGEREHHQLLLEVFSQINREYIRNNG